MKWLLDSSAEAVLERAPRLDVGAHTSTPGFRGLMGDFDGVLLFQTRDGSVRKYVKFHDGRMETHEYMNEKPNVTITFTDGRALVNFLFSPVRGYLNDFIADSTSGLRAQLRHPDKHAEERADRGRQPELSLPVRLPGQSLAAGSLQTAEGFFMSVPMIFDVRRGSTEDGPGIRTAVFFKGCNLQVCLVS